MSFLFPKHIPLSLRIDLKMNDEALLIPFLERFNVKHYFCVFEQSPSGKEHFQCIIWMISHCEKQSIQMRNYWRIYFRDLGEHVKNHHPISITKSKHPKHLAAYCKKTISTQPFIITNLSIEQIGLIPVWLDKQAFKKRDYHDKCAIVEQQLRNVAGLSIDNFISEYTAAYLDIIGKLPSNKLQYYKLAYKLNLVDAHQYSILLGVDFNKIRPLREKSIYNDNLLLKKNNKFLVKQYNVIYKQLYPNIQPLINFNKIEPTLNPFNHCTQ